MNKMIVAASLVILLAAGMVFFSLNIPSSNFAAYDVYNTSSDNANAVPVIENKVFSQEDALRSMNDSEAIILEMQWKNFSVSYMRDKLLEAERVFEQVRYAEILRGEVVSTDEERQKAAEVLTLVPWQNLTYKAVLNYTEEIKQRRDRAFLLVDRMTVEENYLSANGLNGQIVISDKTRSILVQAKSAFAEERYDDTEKLLSEFDLAVENEKTSASTLAGIQKGAMSFFRDWLQIIISIFIALIVLLLLSRWIGRVRLRSKVRKMHAEHKALVDLMKRTQEERYKTNNLSGLVYNIRMKKYEERLQEIKEELPVLEEHLKKFK